MSRPVVVPLVDSLFTARAIPFLVEIARRCDVTMHVVDLRAEPSIVAGGLPDLSPHTPPGRRNRTLRDGYSEYVARQLAEVLGSTRVRTAVREGPTAAALMTYAREQEAGLVVIAIENRDAAGEGATRALAEKMARESGVPVFLMATTGEETRGTFIAAMDGTERSRDGLQAALIVANVAGAWELEVRALSGEQISPAVIESDPLPIAAPAQPR